MDMQEGKLNGKVAIVTGAGRGIGRGIAERFGREKAQVIVVDREPTGLETVEKIKSEGHEATWINTNVGDSEQVQDMVRKVIRAYGKIDILVNNAAVQYLYLLWELPDELFDAMVTTNLRGYFLCAKYVIPHMMTQKKGNIINISSNLAMRALRKYSVYSTTKGGIVAMSKALALESAPYGIRVNCICPGTTLTPILNQELSEREDPEAVLDAAAKLMPVGRLGLPEDIASLVVFLASEESTMVLGATLIIDGGASIQLPSV